RARRSFKRSQSVQSCRALSLVTNVLFLVRSLAFASAQALRQMFIVGRQFDQRFAYGRIERLARQSLPFLRLGMKLLISLGVGSVCGGWPGPPVPSRSRERRSARLISVGPDAWRRGGERRPMSAYRPWRAASPSADSRRYVYLILARR